ncbi:MAG: ABC transporter permease [Corynebacterium casei]|uniref:ABC transporter permease n=1 Tax=Corynebacterium casei TaxID=160386 RepID=UPI003F912940
MSSDNESTEVRTRPVNIEIVDDSELVRLQARPALVSYILSLWNFRHFIWEDTKSKSFSSGKGTNLGQAWILLDPILQVGVYVIVFGLILKVDRGMDNFIGFLLIGVIFFRFFSSGITSGGKLIQRSRNLIKSFTFPKVTLAVSVVLRQMIDHIVPALIAVTGALLFQWGEPVSFALLGVIPLFLLAHLFAFGCTCFAARATAFVPDLAKVLSLVTRALFFTSGVFFSISRFDSHPALTKFVEINPIYQFLQATRSCVLEGVFPSVGVWLYLLAWSVILVIFGFVYFWQAEERYVAVR